MKDPIEQVRILYNSISDVEGQQLYPYLEARSFLEMCQLSPSS